MKENQRASGTITIEIKSEVTLEDGKIVKNNPKSYNFVTLQEPQIKAIFEEDDEKLLPMISSTLENAKAWIERKNMEKEDSVFFDEDIWQEALWEIKASREIQPAIKDALEKLLKKHLEKFELHTPKFIFGTSSKEIKFSENEENGFARRLVHIEGDKK